MSKIVITCESTCDLPKEFLDNLGVKTIDLHYEIDGKSYGADGITSKEFYDAMRNGSDTKTMQVNPYEAEEFLREVKKDGCDILHLGFASVLSGTYNSFLSAAKTINDENENGKIVVVDTKAESAGQGLLVTLVAEKLKEGVSFDELVAYAEEMKGRINHYFTVDNLKYLARGGRISKTSAFIGNLLNIKPVLHTDVDGGLKPLQKTMGRRKAIRRLYEKFVERYDHASDHVYITHADCEEDAKMLAGYIKESHGITVDIFPLSYVIGSHSGPSTLALFFTANGREDAQA